jgi:hypothetical protein
LREENMFKSRSRWEENIRGDATEIGHKAEGCAKLGIMEAAIDVAGNLFSERVPICQLSKEDSTS